MKVAFLAIFCLTAVAVADSLVTEGNLHPRRMQDVIYYDDSFCFVVGEHKDSRGLFVHSKSHKKWIQIKKIPTKGGRFG
jgi:hypothetical protein